MTGAVQDASQLQEDASKLGAGSAEGQAKSRFGAAEGQAKSRHRQFRKKRPDPSFTAMVF